MSLPIAPQLDFSEIPVIDLSPLIAQSDDAATIVQLADACERVGFFYVKNHGIGAEIVSRLHQQAQLFFKQPVMRKEQLRVDYKMRGYLPLNYRSFEGEERAATSHQEGFWVGHETPETAERSLDGANRWPADLPAFRPAMEDYFIAVEALGRVLMRGFARSLDLDVETLVPLFDNPTTRLKLNHYPPQETPTDEHHIGVVPHADSGAFTILWQDGHGGLEIQNKKGEWVGAPPIENTFVVNLGNIMQIWSGGRFSSTKHRVINRGENDRYSIPLFVNPNQETVIRPLIGDDTMSKDSFIYGEYQTAFWRKAFPIAHGPTVQPSSSASV
jgi:isopenicillin N synthase-like dioxygenase